MQISLDYDDTYTLDPIFWDEFKKLAEEFGHAVLCITKRGKDNKGFISVGSMKVHHTNRMAKLRYCEKNGIEIDVWIDDSPMNIFNEG